MIVRFSDLMTAPHVVKPGDTIVMTPGTYRGDYTINVSGGSAAPVTIRAELLGTAIVDGSFDIQGGGYVVIDGIEFTRTDWTTRTFALAQSTPPNINVGAAHIAIRNCVIHDGNQCMTAFEGRLVELYGCLLYNGGVISGGSGHGHTLYTHNNPGIPVLIENNIWLGSFNYGFHAHSSGQNYIKNYTVQDNIFGKCNHKHCFGNDASLDYAVQDIVFADNECMDTYWWFNRWSNRAKNIAVTGNYFVGYGDYSSLDMGCCSFKVYDTIVCTGNTFANNGRLMRVKPGTQPDYTVANKAYYGPDVAGAFVGADDANLDFAGWQTQFGDTGSSIAAYPPPDRVRVIPNIYDAGRCHVAVYNYSQADSIMVDVSGVYQAGDVVRVRNAQDYHGDIQTVTVDANGRIAIDMRADVHSVALPIGHDQPIDPMMQPTYGAYVVERA